MTIFLKAVLPGAALRKAWKVSLSLFQTINAEACCCGRQPLCTQNLLAHFIHAPSKCTKYQSKPGAPLARVVFCVENSILSRTFQGAHGAWHHFRPIETCWCAVCSVLTLPPHSLVTLLRKWNIPSPRDDVKENCFDIRKPVARFRLCHY